MNTEQHSLIHETFTASSEGRIHFGQVIGQLISIGVQSYHVDYRAGRASYYLPDDSSIELDFAKPEHPIAAQFNVASIKAAMSINDAAFNEFKDKEISNFDENRYLKPSTLLSFSLDLMKFTKSSRIT